LKAPQGQKVISRGRESPVLVSTHTISPAGAKDYNAASFRPCGAYLEKNGVFIAISFRELTLPANDLPGLRPYDISIIY